MKKLSLHEINGVSGGGNACTQFHLAKNTTADMILVPAEDIGFEVNIASGAGDVKCWGKEYNDDVIAEKGYVKCPPGHTMRIIADPEATGTVSTYKR